MARYGYLLIGLLAYGWVAALVAAGLLPPLALIALLPAAASVAATRTLWQHAERPAELVPAIKSTILAASLHGLLLAGVLAFAA